MSLERPSYHPLISVLDRYTERLTATLNQEQKNHIDEIKRRLRRLDNQYGELMNLNERLVALDGVAFTFDPKTETVTFGAGTCKQSLKLNRADPEVPIKLVGSSATSAYDAGVSHSDDSETERCRMRLEELLESYYQGAHRLLKLVKLLPGLKNFECREITIVRNKLVEHPEGTESYSFGYGTTGPVVRPFHTAGREWIDQGLVQNTRSFVEAISEAIHIASAIS